MLRLSSGDLRFREKEPRVVTNPKGIRHSSTRRDDTHHDAPTKEAKDTRRVH